MTFIITQWKLVLIGILCAALGVWNVRLNHAHNTLYKERATYADNARKASEAARAEEHRRDTELQKVTTNARIQIEQAGSDALAAGDAANRLRNELATYVDRSRKNPGTAAGSTAAAVDVLGDLLGRLDDAAGRYAAEADRNRIAGQTCVAAYEALSKH